MTDQKQNKKKIELLRELNDTKQAAEELISKSREISREGQSVSDMADIIGRYIQTVPDDSYIEEKKWDGEIAHGEICDLK